MYFRVKCKATHYYGYYITVKANNIEEAVMLIKRKYPDYYADSYEVLEPSRVDKLTMIFNSISPILEEYKE